MRILKADGQVLDIDDDTAIGIDYQAYDFKKPGDIKVNVSNTFSIPSTIKNLKIFGFAGKSYSYENFTFTRILIDYYIKNEQYITKGVARIEKIEKGRINLFVAERPEFIDQMKTTPLNTFLKDWFDNEFVVEVFSPFSDFIEAYKTERNGVVLPFVEGNLNGVESVQGLKAEGVGVWDGTEYKNILTLSAQDRDPFLIDAGGHFCVFIDKLLLYIETFFSVDLNSGLTKDYNLFNDTKINELFIPIRNIYNRFEIDNGNINYFLAWGEHGTDLIFPPLQDARPFEDLTVYDFFITTLKLLGYAIEPLEDGTWEIVRLDLINLIDSKTGDELPGYMAEGYQKEKFIPNIEGYGVNNYIKMKPFSDGGELLGAKQSVSANKNLDETKDLFTIDSYVPPFKYFNGDVIPSLAEAESFKSITFFKLTDKLSNCFVGTNFELKNSIYGWSYNTTLMIPEVYTVASEYTFLDNILATPETRTVKRWVNSSMMKGFRKLAPYYVREFGAWYFVNKISNFNPEKSKEPVKFELIRLPWVRMPGLPEREIESTDEWILADGTWNDSGIWIDTEQWNDTDPNL